jgi:hypothetical protein
MEQQAVQEQQSEQDPGANSYRVEALLRGFLRALVTEQLDEADGAN